MWSSAAAGQCGVVLQSGQCGVVLQTGQCGVALQTGQCGVVLQTGQCGVALQTGQLRTVCMLNMQLLSHCHVKKVPKIIKTTPANVLMSAARLLLVNILYRDYLCNHV